MSPQSSSLSNGRFHYCISGECCGRGKARLRNTSDPAVAGPFLRATHYLGAFPPQSSASPSVKGACSSSSHTDVFPCSANSGGGGLMASNPMSLPIGRVITTVPSALCPVPLEIGTPLPSELYQTEVFESPFPYSNRSLRIRDLRADVPCPGVSDPTGRPPSADGMLEGQQS